MPLIPLRPFLCNFSDFKISDGADPSLPKLFFVSFLMSVALCKLDGILSGVTSVAITRAARGMYRPDAILRRRRARQYNPIPSRSNSRTMTAAVRKVSPCL